MGGSLSLGKRCNHEVFGRREELLIREDASGVFSAYQAFMGNIQTVSTLLLGFLITGTLLSVVLTGSENFGADKIYEFTTRAVFSVLFSGMSMLLGFIIQARGTSAYENFGALKAVKSMRRSTLCICLAESCIYMSLIFFLWSLQDWILMHYVGPDICPQSQDQPSTEAFCSQLGVDFYLAMKRTCGDPGTEAEQEGDAAAKGDQHRPMLPRKLAKLDAARLVKEANLTTTGRHRVDNRAVCEQLRYMAQSPRKLMPPLKPQHYAVWDCTVFVDDPLGGKAMEIDECESPEHLSLMNDVSEILCEVREMSILRWHLCASTSFLQNAEKCAEAYTAYRKSMECVDNNLADAKKCYQVCQWTNNEPPRKRLHEQIDAVFQVSTIVLLVVSVLRAGRGLHQACYVFMTDKASVSKQLLHQTFIKDPESSEDEADEATGALRALPPRGVRDCAAVAKPVAQAGSPWAGDQSDMARGDQGRPTEWSRQLMQRSSDWSSNPLQSFSPLRPPGFTPLARSPPPTEATLPKGWGSLPFPPGRSHRAQSPSRDLRASRGGHERVAGRDPEWAGADADEVPDCSVF